MTEYKIIDGQLLKKMIINGTLNLKKNYQQINSLNVFPVPDGDTGTNMKITMMEGIQNLKKINDKSILTVTKILNDDLLLSSKGNSGIILSQFFSGIHDHINVLQKKQININEFIQSLENGYKKAYKAVIKPVEGTILTVLRESIEKIKKNQDIFGNVKEVIENLLKYARISLEKTPMLLSVLKKSKVVDSGGAGFISILEGMLLYLNNIELKEENIINHNFSSTNNIINRNVANNNIKYHYCTEFIIKLNKPFDFDTEKATQKIKQKGDSLIFLKDKNLLKIHIHTNEPGYVLTYLLSHGCLLKSKIDNMQEQCKNQKIIKTNNPIPNNVSLSKDYILIAFVSGEEVQNIFKDLKVDYTIDLHKHKYYEQILKDIFAKISLPNVIILPNNIQMIPNIQKIIDLFSDINIYIIPSANIAQSYSALLVFDENLNIKKNLTNMKKNIQKNQISEITYTKNIKTKKNNFLAILKGKFIFHGKDLIFLIQNVLTKMIKNKNKFLTIFYHKKPLFEKQLIKIENFLENKYPHLEIEKIENNNNLSPYIFSLE
ncbi:MAG: DAK2 domain-containing protein [Vigna little leaf phytoplasma]|nr:DAK2 domain-containing protein [Vigna little leaf phytoplasma]